jgi:hypothetical protein
VQGSRGERQVGRRERRRNNWTDIDADGQKNWGITTATPPTETHETSQPDKLALFLLGKTDKERG